ERRRRDDELERRGGRERAIGPIGEERLAVRVEDDQTPVIRMRERRGEGPFERGVKRVGACRYARARDDRRERKERETTGARGLRASLGACDDRHAAYRRRRADPSPGPAPTGP